MVGRSGGTLGGRERIVIVDGHLSGRLKRAGRRHVLRRPQTWTSALVTSVVLLLCVSAPDLLGGRPGAVSTALLAAPGIYLVATAAMLGYTVFSIGRHFDREFVPGRILGLTVGSQTIRFRDHDSCTELAYSVIGGVVMLRDVVVVDLGQRFWALPIELFDGVSLEVLRTRAGRPTVGNELWPELQS
ncbi:hypothetical protein [Pedococcus bigeumensis]|uniref:hypothetical protein n=1 Tax=Pedococcus bigeumensis TaxID=433644 RepID=UPI002FE8BB5D